MTTPTIYYAGGEDSEFTQFGGCVISTASAQRRTALSRCSLASLNPSNSVTGYWQNTHPWTAVSEFWCSARVNCSSAGGNTGNNIKPICFADSSGVRRLQIRGNGTTSTFVVEKLDSTGTTTQLGSTFLWTPSGTSGVLDKVDVHVRDNSSTGLIEIFINSILVFTFSGDTTTNSVNQLCYVQLGNATGQGLVQSFWSEIFVTDTDTRGFTGLQTLAPSANGNTHNFDTGTPAAANVNETTLDDTTFDGSTTAGQIDEYTIPAIASGGYGIIAIGVSARAAKGSSGPSKIDLMVRSNSTDYVSSDLSLTANFDNYQNWWMVDPNTTVSWTAFPSNIGVKSVT